MRNILLLLTATVLGCAPANPTAEKESEVKAAQYSQEQVIVSTYVLNSALERTGYSAIRTTDPRTADAFWAERDLEIDAVIDHISTHDFSTVSEKLSTMVIMDQSLRQLIVSVPRQENHFSSQEEAEFTRNGIGERMGRIDKFNTETLKAMLRGRNWFRDDKDGESASFNAWLIVQHADRDPDFQRTVLPMIEAALDTPGNSKQNYAYLHDRVAMAEDRPQLFGTQGQCMDVGVWEPREIVDSDQIDVRRAEMELGPIADYIAGFKDICLIADAKN